VPHLILDGKVVDTDRCREKTLSRKGKAIDLWYSGKTHDSVGTSRWRVPFDEVPRSADHEAQVRWLYEWRAHIDSWIIENQPSDATVPSMVSLRDTAGQPRNDPHPLWRTSDSPPTNCRAAASSRSCPSAREPVHRRRKPDW
jgi:hypothetical protein